MLRRIASWITEAVLKRMASIDFAEQRLLQRPGVFPYSEHSKTTMPFENATLDTLTFREKRTLFPRLLRAIAGHKRSLRALRKNPKHPKTMADPLFFEALERRAMELGALAIGYSDVPSDFIFRNRGILWPRAVVLTQAMDPEIHKLAPSFETMVDIIETYRSLGEVANGLADFLRAEGFGAQAAPAVSQYVDFPRLGERAALGLRGRLGILISPGLGPCQRVAAVFTSIENLPLPLENEHAWIADFCRTCGRCVRKCPGKAIYETAMVNEHGQTSFVDNALCVEQFEKNYSCSVCVKECAFFREGYSVVKDRFDKRK